jgi:hypothetical protein
VRVYTNANECCSSQSFRQTSQRKAIKIDLYKDCIIFYLLYFYLQIKQKKSKDDLRPFTFRLFGQCMGDVSLKRILWN